MKIEKGIFAYKTSRVLSVEDKRNLLYTYVCSNLREKNEGKELKFFEVGSLAMPLGLRS
jgi:hypothetical protein